MLKVQGQQGDEKQAKRKENSRENIRIKKRCISSWKSRNKSSKFNRKTRGSAGL